MGKPAQSALRACILPPCAKAITKLTHLDVHGWSEIREMSGVESLNSFKCLNAWKCEKLQILPELGQLTKLTQQDGVRY